MSGEIEMTDHALNPELQQGQREVEEIIRSELRKQGIEMAFARWWSDNPVTRWEIEVITVEGLNQYQKLSPKQLTGFHTDNRLKMQVFSKVAGLVGKFMKLTQAENSTKSDDLK